MKNHIILCGYGTAGQDLAASLKLENKDFVVVEMNPVNIERARQHAVSVVYGDALNEQVLKETALDKAAAVVISFGDSSTIAQIVKTVRRLNADVLIVVRTRYERDVAWMYDLGADIVIMEELEVSLELNRVILKHLNLNDEIVKTHIDRIRARKEFLVEQNIFKQIR